MSLCGGVWLKGRSQSAVRKKRIFGWIAILYCPASPRGHGWKKFSVLLWDRESSPSSQSPRVAVFDSTSCHMSQFVPDLHGSSTRPALCAPVDHFLRLCKSCATVLPLGQREDTRRHSCSERKPCSKGGNRALSCQTPSTGMELNI